MQSDDQRAAELLGKIAKIACGMEVGYTGRLRAVSRHEMMEIARDICQQYGVSYSQSELVPLRTDPTSKRNVKMQGRGRVVATTFHVKQSPETVPVSTESDV